jgi:hypothetical protein
MNFLEADSKELVFTRNLVNGKTRVFTTLQLTNVSDSNVSFKIKTANPH